MNMRILSLKEKKILRKATPNEVNDLPNKDKEEKSALLICHYHVTQRNLPMQVIDSELQFDRRKLIFYFMAETRIDFRELVKDLFQNFQSTNLDEANQFTKKKQLISIMN